MIIDKNQIYKFSTRSGNKYLYDNLTGHVVPCSDGQYDILINNSALDKSNNKAKFEDNEYINNLIKCGLFQSSSVPQEESSYLQMMKYPSSRLYLIVTEECNMRCSYCIYSEHYPGIKNYSDKIMDFNTARKAVDYFMKLHYEKEKYGLIRQPCINFYGGEPTRNMSLINKVIEYCKRKEYNPVFLITTNGTLLTGNILNSIVENKIHLNISLDGDKKEHNRKRIFKNGSGSHDIVYKNIIKYKQQLLNCGIEEGLTFSACFDNRTNIVESIKYFESLRKEIGDFYVFFSEVNYSNTTYYNEMKNDTTFKDSFKVLFNDFINCQKNGISNNYKYYSLFIGFCLFAQRPKGFIPISSNNCIIGSKLSVDPDGLIYICERINQQMPIGSIEEGIKVNKLDELYNNFNKVKDKCLECNLSRLCDICLVHVVNNNCISFNNEYCSKKKQGIKKLLSLSYEILENNESAFSDMFFSPEYQFNS